MKNSNFKLSKEMKRSAEALYPAVREQQIHLNKIHDLLLPAIKFMRLVDGKPSSQGCSFLTVFKDSAGIDIKLASLTVPEGADPKEFVRRIKLEEKHGGGLLNEDGNIYEAVCMNISASGLISMDFSGWGHLENKSVRFDTNGQKPEQVVLKIIAELANNGADFLCEGAMKFLRVVNEQKPGMGLKPV